MTTRLIFGSGRWLICILLALTFLLGGCFSTAPVPSAKIPDVFWPKPPARPRIALVNVIRRPVDMGIRLGGLQQFWRSLFGGPPRAIQYPHGLAVDKEGRLYVVDTGLHKLCVFDAKGQSYKVLPQKGKPLLSPIDVAIDNQRGRVFVSDAEDGAVRIFTLAGKDAGKIKRGVLGRPTGLAVNAVSDELLVIDSKNDSLLRFSLADLQLLGVIGHKGVAAGLFNAPTAVTVAPDGSIYVVDTLNDRVQVFTPAGKFIRMFGTVGDAPGHFSRPKGVAVDNYGNVHVVDALFDNIQIFNKKGQVLLSYGGAGQKPGQLWLPSGIAIDLSGRIYVADTYNHRVEVYELVKPHGEEPQ